MMKEQKRIETELVSFEKHLYGSDTLSSYQRKVSAVKTKVAKRYSGGTENLRKL